MCRLMECNQRSRLERIQCYDRNIHCLDVWLWIGRGLMLLLFLVAALVFKNVLPSWATWVVSGAIWVYAGIQWGYVFRRKPAVKS